MARKTSVDILNDICDDWDQDGMEDLVVLIMFSQGKWIYEDTNSTVLS